MITATRDCAEMDPDAALMIRVREDSREAFDDLVRRYGPSLTMRFRRSSILRENAEDLAQEVLLRVYRARHDYVATAALRTWIARIAVNVARNAVRRMTRHPDESPRKEPNGRLRRAARSNVETNVPPALDQLIRMEQRHTAIEVLSRLQSRQRRAMQLVSLDQVPISHAAREMAMTTGALKSLLARARASFRSEYNRLQQRGGVDVT